MSTSDQRGTRSRKLAKAHGKQFPEPPLSSPHLLSPERDRRFEGPDLPRGREPQKTCMTPNHQDGGRVATRARGDLLHAAPSTRQSASIPGTQSPLPRRLSAASLVTGLRDSFVRATARGGTWQGDLFRMNNRHARGRRRGRHAVGSPCSFSRLSHLNSRQSSTSTS